ncbi:hypothetical protein EC957_003932 [Mortierella hygrophila]|uniref:Uncharacterized protein n=1 Tax=Mortierella hygrophila TaxID=979708 RepID=A0A9P6F2V7_9FUNG|nr:hypothetical protein EC957_003932 [Mortierella hygrophila]
MRAVLLLAGVFASVANAYYYEVDVMAVSKDQWVKCVNPATYDFKGIDPSTGKHWDGIGGPCIFRDDATHYLEFHNTDWRLNQFYNVSITAGDVYNQVPSLKTKETGLVIPCTLADEYHAPPNTPEEQLPFRFPNHWLYVCISSELFRNRTEPIVVPTTIATTSLPTTTVQTVQPTTIIQSTTTALPVTAVSPTASVNPTTTAQPTLSCLPGFRGKRTGRGPNGACCSHSDDCFESCVKGVCKVYV